MMAENENFLLDIYDPKIGLKVSTSFLGLFKMSKKSKKVVCDHRNGILDGVP